MPGSSSNAASAPSLLIGVEGGGTKTVAWIASPQSDGEFEILGRGASGPSNLHAIGLDLTFANLLEALGEAWKDAGAKRTPAAAACLTMAGVDRRRKKPSSRSGPDRSTSRTGSMSRTIPWASWRREPRKAGASGWSRAPVQSPSDKLPTAAPRGPEAGAI